MRHTTPLTPGQPHAVEVGEVTITLVRSATDEDVYSVHTAYRGLGGPAIPELGYIGTEDQARAAARNLYRWFFSGRTVRDLVALVTGATVTLAPAAKGTQTKISDPQVRALGYAIAAGGYLPRGGNTGEATTTQLQALAKRGYLSLASEVHGRRKVIVGGHITRAGRIRHLRATGADKIEYALAN